MSASYRIVSALVHQPRLLRWVASLLVRWPGMCAYLCSVPSLSGMAGVSKREASFSHAAYAPVLSAGPFLIGMEGSAAQEADRELLMQVLPQPERFALGTLKALPALLEKVKTRQVFDLIEDYMMPLAWAGLREAFQPNASALEAQGPFLKELRYLGAQLIIGKVAPVSVQQRALRSAARIRSVILATLPQISQAWAAVAPRGGCDAVERNAIGLLWVGHPATVQAGALIMRELLERPNVHRELIAIAKERNSDAASCAEFRDLLRNHILELLRFRPPFPFLQRDVPRDALFCPVAGATAAASAGSTMLVWSIGAMFDPAAQQEPPADYVPGRHFYKRQDRYLMFGLGDRVCIATEQVIEMLITALAGLLALGDMNWADPWWRRLSYDGPVITMMRLRRAD